MDNETAAAEIHRRLSQAMNDHIAPIFVPGMKLTVMARLPDNPDADVLLSNDTLEGVTEIFERTKARAEKRIGGVTVDGA